MNNTSSESQKAPKRIEKRTLKANKACEPCRISKVKCDALVIGLPCSSCTSRQRAKDCVLPARKGRTRRVTTEILATSSDSRLDGLNQLGKPRRSEKSSRTSSYESTDCQSPRQTESDLLYLNILNDVAKETVESSPHCTTYSTSYRPSPEDDFTPQNCLWTNIARLDHIDNEYLARKGVFDLPSTRLLDALIKTYFDHVHPFSATINRTDFIRSYQSGDCSLFLLHVVLTVACIHAPADVISACGFACRSEAQESFFSRARLLHDFATENDSLLILQGCIILCTVILDHPSDRDFGYWFHNAIRLATKLEIRNTCIRENRSRKVLQLYRRIWWALYSLDIFHVFVNPRRTRLLEDTSAIKPRTEDDMESEDLSEATSMLLSPLTPQQRAHPVVHCELSIIFAHCLSVLKTEPRQDPRRILRDLDAWRKSLPEKLHVEDNTGTDVYYLNIQAMSYRFECVLCRLIRRRWSQSQHTDWTEWAGQRLRSAILELVTIAMRVLANGTFLDFPMSFVTTITALLALHIESALDSAETDLVRSMARISISQSMLFIKQGKEIPALKRALPIFEEILNRNNLYIPANPPGHVQGQAASQDNSTAETYVSSQTPTHSGPLQLEHWEDNPSLYGDFLGLDFLDDWRLDSWISPANVDMIS